MPTRVIACQLLEYMYVIVKTGNTDFRLAQSLELCQ